MDTNNDGRRQVLIADDQESIRNLLREKLEQEGFDVIEAADGDECLRLFRDRKPPIVITDIKMPGPGGEEVVRTVKQISPMAIAIILTGFGTLDSVRRMMAVGCDGYLLKPVTNLDSVIVAITQAEERHLMLTRNALLRRRGRTQSEALHTLMEELLPPIGGLQENLTAMRASLEERDLDELSELLDAAESDMSRLGFLIGNVGGGNAEAHKASGDAE